MNGGEELSVEATRLISHGEQVGIVLRALGSVGVGLHCPPSLPEMLKRERRPKDIDLVGRKQDRGIFRSFFESEGYQTDRNILVAMEGARYLFRHPERGIDVDLWVDILDLCHKLDVTRRLGDGPTLPIEDLLLSKLQIVELTENDMQDLACMFSIHDLGGDYDDPEMIDVPYITGILGDDWGFWRTVTDNLQKLVDHMEIGGRSRADRLLADLQISPKSTRWKIRARVGERVQWWQDVDIPRDTY